MRFVVVFLACFTGGFCPLVNADAILLGAALLNRGGGTAVLIVLAVVGQVAGKLVLFMLVRTGARPVLRALGVARAAPDRRHVLPAAGSGSDRPAPPAESALALRARAACVAVAGRLPPTGGIAVMVSAATGLPPFFAVTFAAAAGRISAPRFCAAAAAGRFVRTALIVFAPRILIGG
jgi:membrane protein YqaA with SNARE-associated domain